jgi:hypothetical protein
MPFCTTSWAALTTSATLGLASNVCGSVFGLLSMAVTWTYFPPIWPMTLAYSFSAPTATIFPLDAAEAGEQAAASRTAPEHRAAAAALERRGMV